MRWYSVKKYRPLVDGKYIVATSCHNVWVGVYDGELFYDDEYHKEIFSVTHFAVIEPVEIEE